MIAAHAMRTSTVSAATVAYAQKIATTRAAATYSRRLRRRTMRWNEAARRAISSTDRSIGWRSCCCQRSWSRSRGDSLDMVVSLRETTGQHVLDAVHLGGDIAHRQSGDL